PQEPQLDPEKTVQQCVEEGVAGTRALLDRFEEISQRFAEPMGDDEMEKLLAEQGKLQDAIDAADAWELDRRLDIAMDALRLPPPDAVTGPLSGGEKRRVALCRLLLQHPDILLLDEPTNHLDAESVAWLERFLVEYPGTVVAVTHDRYFLDNAAGWILELDRGRGIPWEGNYSSWLEQKEERLALEEKSAASRRKTLARELEWIRMGTKARHAKGQARINQYEKLLNEEHLDKYEAGAIVIPPGPRLGDLVIEAEGLSKAYGDRVLFEDISFRLPPGGIVGVIGPNGAGKSTLLRMLTGAEQPDSGTIRIGSTVQIAYVDQSRDALDPGKSVHEEISEGLDTIELGKRKVASRAYCAAFNFKGSDQQKRVGDLSGGERNRVHLAKLLKKGGNLILLDEPTNDLDVDTLRSLEEALVDFAGCAVVVSHDRWFLDRIATHMLAFEEDGTVVWFEGNFQDYEDDRKKRLGVAADTPHRMQYKKLVR
ncbi:MAG TPA: energy-dependent translational throttle protein EttA, partial [Candidatus Deferrimicrobiaceae bacterium]